VTREVNLGALRLVILLMAVLLVVGSLVSYDKATAQMFGVMGGVILPFVALLYEVALP
jgi:hypothetical protein